MTSLYLIRHAEAQGNVEKRFQGRIDSLLTETGKTQCQQLKQRMRAIPLSAVYASPLTRAFETAEAVASSRNKQPILCPEIIEVDGGAFENQRFEDLHFLYPEEFRQFVEQPDLFQGVGGGEPLIQVYNRMVEAIGNLVSAHQDQVIAAVSHGAAIRCYLCYAMNLPLKDLASVPWSPNTGVSHIMFDDRCKPTVQYVGDDSHLRFCM